MIHWRDEHGDWHEAADASGIGMWPTAIVMPTDDEDAEGIAAGAPWVAMVTIDEAAPRSRGCRTLLDAMGWATEYIARSQRS
jgi:hypothetical protein